MTVFVERGFSLLELMIAIAITAFLVVAAAPSLNYVMNYGALNGAQTQIRSALQMARAEAIKRGESVFVIPFSATNDDANEFGNGVLVWVDLDDDGIYDAGEEIAEVNDLVDVMVDLQPNATSLSFSSEGRLEQNQTEYRFEVCKPADNEGYAIEVASRSGSIVSRNKNNCNV